MSALGEQVVDEVVRRHDVTGVVAADVHVRAEYKTWSQLADDKDRRSDYSDEPEGSCDHLAAVGRTVSPMACTAAIYIRAAPWWLHPAIPTPRRASHDGSVAPWRAVGAAW